MENCGLEGGETDRDVITSLLSPIRDYRVKETLFGSGPMFMTVRHRAAYQTMVTGIFTLQSGINFKTNGDSATALDKYNGTLQCYWIMYGFWDRY